MDIVLATNGKRLELLAQTIKSMRKNACNWEKHSLIICFDTSKKELYSLWEDNELIDLPLFPESLGPNGAYKFIGVSKGVGGVKNFGAKQFETSLVKTSPYLMFSDDDMYYLPEWDRILEEGISYTTQLGGWKHPYHKYSGEAFNASPLSVLYPVDAVTGNCFVIRWEDWDEYGPFDENALGPGQSEDYAFSRKIIDSGQCVDTLEPSVAVHCGIVNSEGNPATGATEMYEMARAQLEALPSGDTVLFALPNTSQTSRVVETNIIKEKSCPIFLNLGSGQRRFDPEFGWVNIDCVSRPPDQVPDLICDISNLPFQDSSVDIVCFHHVIEHFGCGEADGILKESWRVLKPGGSLLVFVPDLKKLAGRWLGGEISDYIFNVNVYGAYQGEPGDRHAWGFSQNSLATYLFNLLNTPGIFVIPFDGRSIPGADIASDFWIAGVEVVKP